MTRRDEIRLRTYADRYAKTCHDLKLQEERKRKTGEMLQQEMERQGVTKAEGLKASVSLICGDRITGVNSLQFYNAVSEQFKPKAWDAMSVLIEKARKLVGEQTLRDLDVGIPLGVTRGLPSDVHLTDETMPREIFGLMKRYIPKGWTSAHRMLEGKALRLIGEHSSPVIWPMGKARFLMPDSVPIVLEHLRLIKTAFDEQTEVCVDGHYYYEMRQKVLVEHPKFKDALEKCFPHPTKMRQRFRFEWHLFEVALPKAAKLKAFKSAKREAVSKAIEEEAEKARQAAQQFYQQHVAMITHEVSQTCTRVAERVAKGEIVTERTLESISDKLRWFERMCGLVDSSTSGAALPQIGELKKLVGNTLASDVRTDPDIASKFQSALTLAGEAVMSMSDISLRPGQYGRSITRGE